MKTSLSALTGKRCGPETSDPADIEKNHVKPWLQSLDFQKQSMIHWKTSFTAHICI